MHLPLHRRLLRQPQGVHYNLLQHQRRRRFQRQARASLPRKPPRRRRQT
jgi:hypothetical protein